MDDCGPLPGDALLDLPPSYKVTELGLLPEEWEVVQLGQTARITMGQSPPSSTYNNAGDGLPFLQGKAEFGEIYPTPIKWCSSPAKTANPGAVLVSVRAPVGDVNIAPVQCCIGRGLAAIDGVGVQNDFLFYWLRFSKASLEARGTGTTFKSINKDSLTTVSMPLPPIPEQRAIAQVLRTVQRAREATERVIAATRELKKSLMRHLFTYGPVPVDQVGQVRLKETEIGPVPEHWKVVPLGKVAAISTGTTPSTQRADYYDGTLGFVRTSEIVNNKIERPSTYISEQAVRDYGLKVYQPGVVFMAMYGQGKTRGQVALLACAAATSQNAAAISPKPDIDSTYLWLYLMSQYERLRGSGIQGHISHLNLGYVKQLVIPMPPLAEQRDIVAALVTATSKEDAEEKRRQALDSLFKTLLHHLMTGKVRVENPEGPVSVGVV